MGNGARPLMALLNLPDPDVLAKWGQRISQLCLWSWNSITRREARACRKFIYRLDLLVGNAWPYLSAGSTRVDSLRSVLEEVTRNCQEESRKVQGEILNRNRDLGEWLSFYNTHLRHILLLKPTRLGLVDSVVELNALLNRIEKVMDDFRLTGSTSSLSEEGRKNYLRFRDTYNRFLTDYETFCREARATFREIQEPAFKRLE